MNRLRIASSIVRAGLTAGVGALLLMSTAMVALAQRPVAADDETPAFNSPAEVLRAERLAEKQAQERDEQTAAALADAEAKHETYLQAQERYDLLVADAHPCELCAPQIRVIETQELIQEPHAKRN